MQDEEEWKERESKESPIRIDPYDNKKINNEAKASENVSLEAERKIQEAPK